MEAPSFTTVKIRCAKPPCPTEHVIRMRIGVTFKSGKKKWRLELGKCSGNHDSADGNVGSFDRLYEVYFTLSTLKVTIYDLESYTRPHCGVLESMNKPHR